MVNKRFKLGMGQILVEGGRVEENLLRAKRMAREAAAKGCRIVVLPECLDFGWCWEGVREEAAPIPGKCSDEICSVAKEFNIHVVAGLTERAGDRLYNSAILVSPTGEILLKHRKINILDIAQHLYSIGDTLSVAETELGTVAVNICADNFPDTLALAHSQARMGAQLLLSPCAWAVDADHDNKKEPYGDLWTTAYTRLTRLYDLTIVGVSNVGDVIDGVWKGRKCIGCSLAVGPGGTILAVGPYGKEAETLLVVDVETVPHAVKGSDITPALRAKGFEVPFGEIRE